MPSSARPAPRVRRLGTSSDAALIAQAKALGFDHILLPASESAIPALAGLDLLLDIDLSAFSEDDPLVVRHPQAFSLRHGGEWRGPMDPRQGETVGGAAAIPRLNFPAAAALVGDWAATRLQTLAREGAAGFCVRRPEPTGDFWRRLIASARQAKPDLLFIADTRGMAREAAMALAGHGFDYVISSLAWWDGRATWLAEEYQALGAVAPLLAEVDSGKLLLAAAVGTGMVAVGPLDETASEATALAAGLVGFSGPLRQLTGPGAPVTALLRTDAADAREALLILVGADDADLTAILSRSGLEFTAFEPVARSGEVRLFKAGRAAPIIARPIPARTSAKSAATRPRLVIEGVSPVVEGGAFAVKRTVGETVVVEADAFADGHTPLAVELLWRPLDEEAWRMAPMVRLPNDRWRASFTLERLGRWEFTIEAWVDVFGGLAANIGKKAAASVVQPVDLEEARLVIAAAAARAKDEVRARLEKVLAGMKSPAESLGLIAAPQTAALMAQADNRPFHLRREPAQMVDAERLSARFASWYELFPRSQSDQAARHGTFDDVIARLPAIAGMGFDVLYMPPIHPIGRINRKGRDNSLKAGPDDPGSPYAIGAAEGGHDAIHPELGNFAAFQRLIAAAREYGLEIALDFAIQCSPDHPWLKQHPEWFDWRPDGSIHYAENPPKKYEDIVNVEFYKAEAIPALWIALRDIVLFWIGKGVRTFRVDNPHTKPLAFWEWMIADVRGAHPEAIFLAEAFTQPKPMYRLAKVGFSQSYTYFTWRHSKRELTDYLTELASEPVSEFFRPHFFVNTPDINPYFLQSSGRAGFLIRAALATTLSGLWGMYSGFELLEAEPVPGKEDYKASEKYEIKPRDWSAPGNIVADIARLNRIRKAHPALQTQLGVRFYSAFNDNIIYYGKAEAGMSEMILVAVSLDPHQAQTADFEAPLWEFGLADDAGVAVEDLVHDLDFTWWGKRQRLRLTPEEPYAIWRVRPKETN